MWGGRRSSWQRASRRTTESVRLRERRICTALVGGRFPTDMGTPFGGKEPVEPRGLEPLTPCLQSRCATNCAMAPLGAVALPIV